MNNDNNKTPQIFDSSEFPPPIMRCRSLLPPPLVPSTNSKPKVLPTPQYESSQNLAFVLLIFLHILQPRSSGDLAATVFVVIELQLQLSSYKF